VNPWEKYQSPPAPSAGPWSKYGQGTAVDSPPAAEPLTEGEALASSVPARFLSGLTGPAQVLLKMVGPDYVKNQIAQIDAMRQRGMEKQNTGFDWAGLAGSLVPGGLLTKAVTKALPAATSLAGKMAVGAAAGGATAGAQPLPGNNELSTDKLKQMAGGAAVGGTIPALVQGVKSFFGTNQLNPTQSATLKEGQAAGYTVPPSMVNPSGLNNVIESLAGKDAVKQAASARNQKVTNALTAKALGLPADEPITPSALEGVRTQAGKVYDQVAALSPNAKWALGELKQARHDANVQYNFYNRSGNPEALTKAQQASQMADVLDQEIQNEAAKAGRSQLVNALTEARTKIAKSYDVERALSEADSNVSAPTLGRSFDKKGGKAVTGELATIGKVAEAFKPVMREGASVPVAGVSGTDALASAMLGGIGLGTSGPLGAGAAALPWIVRPAARNLVLSKAYQNTLAQGIPARYQPLIDAMTQQAIAAGGTTAGRNY